MNIQKKIILSIVLIYVEIIDKTIISIYIKLKMRYHLLLQLLKQDSPKFETRD